MVVAVKESVVVVVPESAVFPACLVVSLMVPESEVVVRICSVVILGSSVVAASSSLAVLPESRVAV